MAKAVNKPLLQIGSTLYSVDIEKDGSVYSSFVLKAEKLSTVSPSLISLPSANSELIILDSVMSGIGRKTQADFSTQVIKPILEKLGAEHKIIKTKSSTSIAEFAREIEPSKSYTIIFLSGDTSISEFLNHIPAQNSNSKYALNIYPIPMGTGNAWASSLNLKCPVESFQKFLKNDLIASEFPLYRASFPNGYSTIFFIILSIGFHANLLHLCNHSKYKVMGVERFKAASAQIFKNYDLKYKVSIPNRVSGCYAYFAIINTPNLEPTYKPSPLSDPLTSALHLLGFESSLESSELIKRITRGRTAQKGDDIMDTGVIYEKLEKDFDIVVEHSPSTSDRTKFEICCDGQLLNLLDMQGTEGSFDGTIKVSFLQDYSPFNLKVLSPA